ncbi:hypothetical protein BD410DRAFT_783986 [Rickenella mellea]|uniref:Adhesin domain-containing protein n=1 Tax=Rickenella mellea TaxID=50990 RepID=A0A4Y7QFV0_9AGAM|nr:hypothetical protein BD410DRAFT_783986 [Rickenella mellea]
MPRLNRGIVLGDDNNDSNSNDRISSKFTFFGMITGVMAALSLKERWDSYKQLPSESETAGTFPAPPSYRDEPASDDDIGLTNGAYMDTEIPAVRRSKTRRPKSCCVCCGINCGLFWKAFGIVLLLVIIWNTFKLVRWAMTPNPTGLEDMPAYSKSLGCLDAPHWYQDKEYTDYDITLASGNEAHDVEIHGGAVGTLLIAPMASSGANTVKIRLGVRTNEKQLLDQIAVQHFPQSEGRSSIFDLSTPLDAENAHGCLRFDITLYIPSNLKTLAVTTSSVTQIKFDEGFEFSPRALRNLAISQSSRSSNSLLLTTPNLSGDNAVFLVRGGYMTGELAVVNSTIISNAARAVSNVRVTTAPYAGDSKTAYFETSSGIAHSAFTFANPERRPVHSEHTTGTGDMYLTYKEAALNGRVSLKARSYTATGLQGKMNKDPGGVEERWVGDADGGDVLNVVSDGWVRLYF